MPNCGSAHCCLTDKPPRCFEQLRKDATYANAVQTDHPEKLLAYQRKKDYINKHYLTWYILFIITRRCTLL